MAIDIMEVLNLADVVYHQLREDEGRPQTVAYGIESSQIKALAIALVDKINQELEKKETKFGIVEK